MITRYLIFILISLVILFKTGWQLPLCNFKTAKQALVPRIFAETTIDGPNQPVLLTRFLHNKLGIFINESARCYFNVLDLNFVESSTTLIGLLFWLYFIYQITIRKYWVLIVVFLITPIVSYLTVLSALAAIVHKIFAIIGLAWYLKISK